MFVVTHGYLHGPLCSLSDEICHSDLSGPKRTPGCGKYNRGLKAKTARLALSERSENPPTNTTVYVIQSWNLGGHARLGKSNLIYTRVLNIVNRPTFLQCATSSNWFSRFEEGRKGSTRDRVNCTDRNTDWKGKKKKLCIQRKDNGLKKKAVNSKAHWCNLYKPLSFTDQFVFC